MFRILIVDDMKTVHSFAKNLLSKATDLSVTSVFNGQEAIQLLKTGETFDLIFLDWEMPILTGPETMTKYKELNLNIPVIMMTTKNNPEDIQRMLTLGVSEYMLKPFTIDIIFEKIMFATGRTFQYAG